MPTARGSAAAALVVLATVVGTQTPLLAGPAGPSRALAADAVPPDDLTDDGAQPVPAPTPEPGPGVPDDLTDDGTQPAPAPAPEPGPGVPDDLTDESAPPSAPTPTPTPAPTPGAPSAPSLGTTPGGESGYRPAGSSSLTLKPGLGRLTLRVTSPARLARRHLRGGLRLQLAASAPVRVVVTVQGPGRAVKRRSAAFARSGTLTIRPGSLRGSSRSRKLLLTVTAVAADGRRVTVRRTVRLFGR